MLRVVGKSEDECRYCKKKKVVYAVEFETGGSFPDGNYCKQDFDRIVDILLDASEVPAGSASPVLMDGHR
jgi:hypothetical protein